MADLLTSLSIHTAATVALVATGALLTVFYTLIGKTMMWNARPWLLFPLYTWPMATAGLAVHSLAVFMRRGRGPIEKQAAHFASMQLLLAAGLLLLTVLGVASAYLLLIPLLFTMLREVVLALLPAIKFNEWGSRPWIIFAVQAVCLSPSLLIAGFFVSASSEFFAPIASRVWYSTPYAECLLSVIAALGALTIVALTVSSWHVYDRDH